MRDLPRGTPLLFVDDGFPEARDYDRNYVPLAMAGARRVRPQPPAAAVVASPAPVAAASTSDKQP